MPGKIVSLTSAPMIATAEACAASVGLKNRPVSRSRFNIVSAFAGSPVPATLRSLRRRDLTCAFSPASAPTAAHEPQLASTSLQSAIVIAFRRLAMRNSERLRRIPNLVNTRTSGLRLIRFVVTKAFRPLITETTATTVITPMMTPRSVSPDRSLCCPIAWSEVRNSSRASMPLGRARSAGLHRLLLLVAHRLDLVPFLERPQRLEGAADHGLAVLQAVFDLDVEIPCQPRLDRREL